MKQPRPPTDLEYALLGLLHQQSQSGYDLCKTFETTPIGHYSSSPGAIYPALKRLETRGLIDGEVEGSGSLRPRKVYRLTEAGTETLRTWARHPVTRDDIVWRVDELILRFSFMGQLVDRRTVDRFLDQLIRAVEDLLVELEAFRDGMLSSASTETVQTLPTGRLALEQGIASYRGLVAWAGRARTELAGPGAVGITDRERSGS